MSTLRRQWLPLTVLVVATTTLVATMVWAADQDDEWRGPGGWPNRMMAGIWSVPGDGQVHNLTDAGRAAERFARPRDLTVGEVMEFDNEFYAVLLDTAGRGATEVLIDPGTGDVRVEWGPAMMWNTSYGMPAARIATGDCTISPDEAVRTANRWLRDYRPGETSSHPDAFPGYYTLHIEHAENTVGMLSVHCTSGAVWHHTWHGRFIRQHEHAG